MKQEREQFLANLLDKEKEINRKWLKQLKRLGFEKIVGSNTSESGEFGTNGSGALAAALTSPLEPITDAQKRRRFELFIKIINERAVRDVGLYAQNTLFWKQMTKAEIENGYRTQVAKKMGGDVGKAAIVNGNADDRATPIVLGAGSDSMNAVVIGAGRLESGAGNSNAVSGSNSSASSKKKLKRTTRETENLIKIEVKEEPVEMEVFFSPLKEPEEETEARLKLRKIL